MGGGVAPEEKCFGVPLVSTHLHFAWWMAAGASLPPHKPTLYSTVLRLNEFWTKTGPMIEYLQSTGAFSGAKAGVEALGCGPCMQLHSKKRLSLQEKGLQGHRENLVLRDPYDRAGVGHRDETPISPTDPSTSNGV